MSNLISYYENYRSTQGINAYQMSKWADSSRVRWIKQYIHNMITPQGRILDLGCGDMHLSTVLPGYQWVGLDIDTEMSGNRAIKHDLMSFPYPFESASFDGVICSEVLEHLWSPELVQKEVARLLKPSGTYVFSTPNYTYMDHLLGQFQQLVYDPVKPWLKEHIRQYDYLSHKSMVEAAGMKIIDYRGADAQYSAFFAEPRKKLCKILSEDFNSLIDLNGVDMILGEMFPLFNHTIICIARHQNG